MSAPTFGITSGPASGLVIISIIGPILAALLVFNRVYWRVKLVNALGYDDFYILLSLVFLFVQCALNLDAVNHGYGRSQRTLVQAQVHRALLMFYFVQIFYKFTINLTKLSILALYLRIFSQRWFRLTCIISSSLIAIYAFISVQATIFQCAPVRAAFDKTSFAPGTYHCINNTAFWYANAVFNILTDLVILLSVPGVVWGLHLPLRQRLGLTIVFGLGIFVFATSVLRFTTLNLSSKTSDSTAGTLKSTTWSTIESSCAVICACLPMVRTPMQRVWPRLFPNRSSRNRTTTTTVTGSATDLKAGCTGGRKASAEYALSDTLTPPPLVHTSTGAGSKADKVLGRKPNTYADLTVPVMGTTITPDTIINTFAHMPLSEAETDWCGRMSGERAKAW